MHPDKTHKIVATYRRAYFLRSYIPLKERLFRSTPQ
jgi:hypothetical protein